MTDTRVTLVEESRGKSLVFKNPVTVASGTFGFGFEFTDYINLSELGALTTKAITLMPRLGNPGRRLVETPAGLINSIGLMNPGVEEFCSEIMPRYREIADLPIIVNIGGSSVLEYAALAERLDGEEGIAALEINISCPNVAHGGMAFGTTAKMAADVTAATRAKTTLPLIVKLTPNVTDICEIAQAVEASGADCLSLINTLLGMAIDISSRKPILEGTFGGLSGPAIRPVALRVVYQVFRCSNLPVIGMGGICTWEDAISFILAGASAIAVGTANLTNPKATMEIIAGIANFCEEQNIKSVSDLIGAAHSS